VRIIFHWLFSTCRKLYWWVIAALTMSFPRTASRCVRSVACMFGNLVCVTFAMQTFFKLVRMYYRSGTAGCCCIGGVQMVREHSLEGDTFLHEMASWPPSWNCGVRLKIWLHDAYLFEEQSCQIWSWSDLNDGPLGFFEDGHLNRRTRSVASSDQFPMWKSLIHFVFRGLVCVLPVAASAFMWWSASC